MSPRAVVEAKNMLGEGPIWDPKAARLLWLDIKNRKLFQLDPKTNVLEGRNLPVYATVVTPTNQGDLLLACIGGLYRYDMGAGTCTKVTAFETDLPENRPNDGKTDPQGRLWLGSMQDLEEAPTGFLYSYCADKGLVQHFGDCGIPNTFAWSPDGKWFYHGDSMAQTIWRFPWNGETGALGEREVFVSLKGTDRYPDGSCIDAEGYLWNAQWNGWRVVRYAPDGREDRVVEMPVACPTSCMFGGEGLKTLFITSARKGQTKEALEPQPLAGALFALDPGVQGLAEVPFQAG